jgi:flagellar hook-length control protein FliK
VPIYNQIAEEISAKLEQKGPMEFKLQLKPENLGEIDVCIKMTEGKLSIDITSANSKTQEMLVSQVDKLITKLGLQNFQVENVQVLPGTSTTTTQDQASQPSLVNLGMNFSDRRQHETLKEQNELRKSLRAMSSLNATEKQLNSGIGMVQGNHYSGHKINYSF